VWRSRWGIGGGSGGRCGDVVGSTERESTGREGRIGETASDFPVFARSEYSCELFGGGRLEHALSLTHICARGMISVGTRMAALYKYECVVNRR
jgi:hypothetical protein